MSEENEETKEERNQETFDATYWRYNCPLQMSPNIDGTWDVLNYMPRKSRVTNMDEQVTKEELPSFCENTARILRNLANLFDTLGAGKIDLIYYPDENVQDAIIDAEEVRKEG